MSESKFKKVMEILEKVIKINAFKGTELVADLRNNGLLVYDIANGCESIMHYEDYINTIYFDEVWEEHFDRMVEAMHKALDKYLV